MSIVGRCSLKPVLPIAPYTVLSLAGRWRQLFTASCGTHADGAHHVQDGRRITACGVSRICPFAPHAGPVNFDHPAM